MEERWLLNDLARELKRKRMRREFNVDENVPSEQILKAILKNRQREERWKAEDTERLRKRIEYRKIHKISNKEDRRWVALTKGNGDQR